MKKFSLFSSVLLLIAVVTFLVVGCQKESASTDQNANNASSEGPVVKGVAGTGTFTGSIDQNYAAALKQNFKDQYDNGNKLSYQVAFSAKDLSAFIATLQSKYKSDIIYVNFGVYGNNAPAPNKGDNGRLTVFFTGNRPGSGSVSTNDAAADDAALNHGNIMPPY